MSTKSLTKWLWPRDERSPQQIEAEIHEELAAHYEQLVADEQRAGVSVEQAERLARERFGDLDGYADQCRRIDLRDRLIVRRALSVACLALLVACGGLAYRLWTVEARLAQLAEQVRSGEQGTRSIVREALDDEAWVERLVSLRDHMHTAFAVGPELTLLAPERGIKIVRAAWPRLTEHEVKTGLLKAFAFSKSLRPRVHSRLFAVLDLGMTDADPTVRKYAASYLAEYATEEVCRNTRSYAEWYAAHGDQSPDKVAHVARRDD
jgi:hypothetical protein